MGFNAARGSRTDCSLHTLYPAGVLGGNSKSPFPSSFCMTICAGCIPAKGRSPTYLHIVGILLANLGSESELS